LKFIFALQVKYLPSNILVFIDMSLTSEYSLLPGCVSQYQGVMRYTHLYRKHPIVCHKLNTKE
jgi:hypothetical protein